MIWVRITSVLFCLVGLAFVLAPSAGELRPTTDVVKETLTVSQPDTVMQDTVYGDDPFMRRVYNPTDNRGRGRSVPEVELDTVVHEKKLWLAEKKRLTPPPKSRYGRIVAQDSMVFVVYVPRDTMSYVYSTYSTNYGADWSEPHLIQRTKYDANPGLLISSESIYLTYTSTALDQLFVDRVLFHRSVIGDFVMSDSIIIDTTFSSSENLAWSRLVAWGDTIIVSYCYVDDIFTITHKKSGDQGDTWLQVGNSIPDASFHKNFLLTDTVLTEIFERAVGSYGEVFLSQSYDKGSTWTERMMLSGNGFHSGSPAASTDGVAGIHAVRYDFEDAPPGWAGYVHYRQSHDAGKTWSDTRTVSPGPYSEDVEVFADTNYVYIVWNDRRFGSPNLALYMRYSHDKGLSWSSEYKIVSEVDPAWDPQIFGDGDQFHMVWREQHPPDWVWGIWYILGVWYVPGDADNSGGVDVSDLSYIVDYLFRGGEPSWVPDAAQMNGTDGVDVSDLTYFVDYLFAGGEPPVGGEPGL